MLRKSDEGHAAVGAILVAVLLVWAVIIIVAQMAKPKYKPGDCAQDTRAPVCERWEKCNNYIYKILEVGQHKYRLLLANTNAKDPVVDEEDARIGAMDDGTQKIECPKSLEKYK